MKFILSVIASAVAKTKIQLNKQVQSALLSAGFRTGTLCPESGP